MENSTESWVLRVESRHGNPGHRHRPWVPPRNENSNRKDDLNSSPCVSVILPVYNGASTIARAVESVLDQTYQDFELIVVNDGSTDNTQAILDSFREARIKVLNQDNLGLVPSLNRGISHAEGKYVARMDADDVALPLRLEKQVEFMEKHAGVAVLGSAVAVIYQDGSSRIRRRPPDTKSILKNIVRICPFCHSSVMIRKAVFETVGLYDVSKDGSKELLVEDYDLWVRLLEARYEMANLPDVLMLYCRDHRSVLGRRSLKNRLRQQILSRVDIISRLKLGRCAYLNVIPVAFFSALGYAGLKLDSIFNIISSPRSGLWGKAVFDPKDL